MYLEKLVPGSPTVDDSKCKFRNLVTKAKLRIYSFYEALPTTIGNGLFGKSIVLVNKDNATPGIEGEEWSPAMQAIIICANSGIQRTPTTRWLRGYS